MKHGSCSPAEDYEATGLSPMNESRAHGFFVRSLLWRTARAARLTVAVGALLSAGCASQDRSGSATAHFQEPPTKAEDPQLVDCLLPAQVRQVGHQFIYHRQTIKTSASDCEIRGGLQREASPSSSSSK
jgi:hypothetical protein